MSETCYFCATEQHPGTTDCYNCNIHKDEHYYQLGPIHEHIMWNILPTIDQYDQQHGTTIGISLARLAPQSTYPIQIIIRKPPETIFIAYHPNHIELTIIQTNLAGLTISNKSNIHHLAEPNSIQTIIQTLQQLILQ